jgi:amino acid transporter
MASIPTRRRSLPAATLLVTVVYVLGAVALLLGGPAQRLVGLAVLAVTAARLTALLGTGRGAAPWS